MVGRSHPAGVQGGVNGRAFIDGAGVQRERLDWGELGGSAIRRSTGAEQLAVIDVTLEPGFGHDFHKHAEQEEVIWVRRADEIEQWLERGPASSVSRPATRVSSRPIVVHASFNTGAETARLTVVLGPASAPAATSSSTSRARSPGAPCGRRCTPPSSRVRRPLGLVHEDDLPDPRRRRARSSSSSAPRRSTGATRTCARAPTRRSASRFRSSSARTAPASAATPARRS